MTFDKDSNKESDRGRNNEQDKFAEKIRQVLDNSTDDIDELTLSRIRAARASAVSVTGKKHAPGLWWIPAGSFATVLVAVLAAYLFNQNLFDRNNGDLTSAMDTSDMEILSSVESLEMLDDLEFFQWLDTELNEELGSSAGTHAETLG